jgi:hypothetical protein
MGFKITTDKKRKKSSASSTADLDGIIRASDMEAIRGMIHGPKRNPHSRNIQEKYPLPSGSRMKPINMTPYKKRKKGSK